MTDNEKVAASPSIKDQLYRLTYVCFDLHKGLRRLDLSGECVLAVPERDYDDMLRIANNSRYALRGAGGADFKLAGVRVERLSSRPTVEQANRLENAHRLNTELLAALRLAIELIGHFDDARVSSLRLRAHEAAALLAKEGRA